MNTASTMADAFQTFLAEGLGLLVEEIPTSTRSSFLRSSSV